MSEDESLVEQLKENGESVKLHLAQVQRLYADIDKEEFETKMKELRAAVNTLIEREEKDLIPCMNNKDYDLDSLGAEVAKLRAGESIEPVKPRKRALLRQLMLQPLRDAFLRPLLISWAPIRLAAIAIESSILSWNLKTRFASPL